MPGHYEVEKIVGKRIKNGSEIQYKVKWKNYASSQNTWEPVKHLKNVNSMIKDFEKRNKDKLSKYSSALREEDDKEKSLPKKNFRKNPMKKVANSRLSKDEEKIAKRQSQRIVKRNQVQEESSLPKSKPSNGKEKDSDNDVQEITNVNETQSQVKDSQLQQWSEMPGFDINLESITNKIMAATRQKQKVSYEILGIVKGKPQEGDLFLIQDSKGQQQYKNREYILKNLPLELIAFYQKQVRFTVEE